MENSKIEVVAQVTFYNANLNDSEPCYTTVDNCIIKLKDLTAFNKGELMMLPIEVDGYVYYIQGRDINQIELYKSDGSFA